MENNPLNLIRRYFVFRCGAAAVFLFIFAISPLVSFSSSIVKERKKLESIQNRIRQLEEELGKYKSREKKIRREITDLKKKEKRAFGKLRSLKRRIYATEKKKKTSEQKYLSLKSACSEWKDALADEMMVYFKNSLSSSDYFGKDDIIKRLFLKSVIQEKFILLDRARQDTGIIRDKIKKLKKKKVILEREKKSARKKQINYRRSATKKTRQLTYVRQEKKRILKVVEKLRADARSLNWLIKKLEKQSPYRKKKKYRLPISKHSLPWPLYGRVVSKFGKERIEKLQTWLVREGIKIETEKNKAVFPVADGEVIYAGHFRSYGNVIIISHERNFSSIYGMLSSINVRRGEKVSLNTLIGRAGKDTQEIYVKNTSNSKSVLYFEIRIGVQAVNPLDWLRPNR